MDPALSRLSWWRMIAPLVLDIAAVVVFVVAGRDEHQQTSTVTDILTVSAPFLIGIAVGSGLAWIRERDLATLPAGLIILLTTMTLGMVLRRVVWDRGTAMAFVVVTAGFLTVTLLGWRTVRRAFRRPGSYSSRLSPSERT